MILVFGFLGVGNRSVGQVGPEGALAPGLRPRRLDTLSLVPSVQVRDQVIVVVLLVVVNVVVLEELRPAITLLH